MKTLATLTLELSNELNRIDKRCRRELASSEAARDRALLTAGAGKILGRYHDGLEKAKRTQLQTTDKADDTRNKDVLAAEDKRRASLLKQERKYRAGRAKAADKKNGAIRKAKSAWRDAIARSKADSLTRRRAARKTADEKLERALIAARELYNIAVEDARLAYRSALQDALVDERLAVDKAHRKAERIFTGAAIDHERAVAQAEARMRRELRTHPEAQQEQQAYDRAVSEIHEACEHDKEEAFATFTRERRRLKRKSRTKK